MKIPFVKPAPEKTLLELEEERLLKELKDLDPKTDKDLYDLVKTHLQDIHKMKTTDKGEKKSVSPDALVGAAASLAGIVMILGFERAHIITSKAMSFVFKPKA